MLFDRLVALIGLVALSPLLLAVGAIVRLSSPGPALFLHERVGRNSVPFRLMKFRTMSSRRTNGGRQITASDDPRITAFGQFLRRYKLDEIPQLINVLRGEMRLVGPRPEVETYVRLYVGEQRRVLDVSPGITDIATLYYRNESEELAAQDDPERYYVDTVLPRKLDLNLRYAEHRSFVSDLGVIALTAFSAVSPAVGNRVRASIGRRYGVDSDAR